MSTSQVSEWSDVALRNGPFFFSLLLFLLTWRFSRLDGGKAGATPAQRKLWLGLSGASYLLAAGVMVSGLVWWFGRPNLHIFEATLRNLKPYERLGSDDHGFFFREELKSVDPGEDQLRNLRFVFVKDRSFSEGDVFTVEFMKEGTPRQTFQIPFSKSPGLTFVVDWNEVTQQNILRPMPVGPVKGAWWRRILSVSAAMAAAPVGAPALPPERAAVTIPPAPVEANALSKPGPKPGAATIPSYPAATTLIPEAQKLVRLLQDVRSGVGEKIMAVGRLGRYDASGITAVMRASTVIGPVAVTIIDLSRHSDPELASKARSLIKRYDLEGDSIRSAARPEDQANLRKILAALDRPQRDRIVSRLTTAQVKALIPSGDSQLGQPIPTGTKSGDRYYVKANWEPTNAAAVACLTSLFNTALVSSRSLEQERLLMGARKDRLIYGYDREWASSIGVKIERCGGRTTFVVPWKS